MKNKVSQEMLIYSGVVGSGMATTMSEFLISNRSTKVQKKIEEIKTNYHTLNQSSGLEENAKELKSPQIIYAKYLSGCFDNIENLNSLIKEDTAFNIKHPHVFHWAVKGGNTQVLLKLKKLDCNIHNNHHEALLWSLDNLSVFSFLVEKMNFDPRKKNNQAFKDACIIGQIDIIDYLISNKLCNLYEVPESSTLTVKEAVKKILSANSLKELLEEKPEEYHNIKI